MYTHMSIKSTKRVVAKNSTLRIIYGMEESWAERAKSRMRALRKTQEDLARPLSVKTRSAVGHYFNGRRKLSADQVIALAKDLDCSIDWLLTGKETGGVNSSAADIPDQVIQLARTIANAPPDRISAALLLLGVSDEAARPKQKKTLPTAQDRRQNQDRRRNNVHELDFERRSGFDQREDKGARFSLGKDREEAKKKQRRDDNDTNK